jgi:GT2 family glycosyltransferase
VVTIAHGRHQHLWRQVRSLSAGTCAADHVVVAMGDPVLARADTAGDRLQVVAMDADPSSLPLAAARNLGAQVAIDRGAETLIFLDVDCLAGPGLVYGYRRVVERFPGSIWSGPVTYLQPLLTEQQLARPWETDDPHPDRPAPAPGEVVHGADPDLFWSLSFAVHRDAWLTSGGFFEEYVGYGGEDTDFAQQSAARGLGFGWVGDARAYHQYHPTQDPPVQHLSDILRNARLFHERWGRWPMLGWLEAFEEVGLVQRTADGWRAVEADVPGQDLSA